MDGTNCPSSESCWSFPSWEDSKIRETPSSEGDEGSGGFPFSEDTDGCSDGCKSVDLFACDNLQLS